MKRQRRIGFSLVEIVIVVSIIVILVAILSPVFARAKMAAKETSSKGRLRQIYVYATLYRQDWDTGIRKGMASEMGLPTFEGYVVNWMEMPKEMYKTPCAGMSSYKSYSNYLWAPDDSVAWKQLIEKYGNSVFIVQDRGCNSSEIDTDLQFSHKVGIVVNFDGAISTRRGVGSWELPEWWGAVPQAD
jgi:type II secretory pathway pseudopilin PulG